MYSLNSLSIIYFNNSFKTIDRFYTILDSIPYKILLAALANKIRAIKVRDLQLVIKLQKEVVNKDKLIEARFIITIIIFKTIPV